MVRSKLTGSSLVCSWFPRWGFTSAWAALLHDAPEQRLCRAARPRQRCRVCPTKGDAATDPHNRWITADTCNRRRADRPYHVLANWSAPPPAIGAWL